MSVQDDLRACYGSLANVDLDYALCQYLPTFAGYRDPDHSVHKAIVALAPGDPLRVGSGGDRWDLLDRNGMVVGQLARGSKAPAGMRCVSATVLAVVNWDREKSEPQYRDGLRSEAWEVVVPELVFEPDT